MTKPKGKIEKLMDYIASLSFIGISAMLSLALMVGHTASVYLYKHTDPTWWDYIIGYSFGIAVDIGVLIFVLRGLRKAAFAFTFIQVLINLWYYHGVISEPYEWIWAVFLSVLLPGIIAIYSEQVHRDRNKEIEERKLHEDIEHLKRQLTTTISNKVLELESVAEKLLQENKADYSELIGEIRTISDQYKALSSSIKQRINKEKELKDAINLIDKRVRVVNGKALAATQTLMNFKQQDPNNTGYVVDDEHTVVELPK